MSLLHTPKVWPTAGFIHVSSNFEKDAGRTYVTPHTSGGWAPAWLVRDWFLMKFKWFCKTFAATTLHMQKQCARGHQGIEKSSTSINLHSPGSRTLKLETLLACFQLCTPLLSTTQMKRKRDFSKESGPQSHGIHMAEAWNHVLVMKSWKTILVYKESLHLCVFFLKILWKSIVFWASLRGFFD